MSGPPLPPLDLAARAGPLHPLEPLTHYVEIGRRMRADIEDLLGEEWSWSGSRVLDFGCGAGRLLRHLLPEARSGTRLAGCDLDPDCIAWLSDNLVPPLGEVHVNGVEPPLPFEPGSFDLVIATSVFTHFAESWASWLLEMRRLLAPGGLLVASFLGPGMSEEIAAEPWDEDRIGMNVVGSATSWQVTNVLHSPWWLRAHWGRAFEILELRESGFAMAPGKGHGLLLGRRRDRDVTAEELERSEPDEPRELTAAQHNVRQLRAEIQRLRALGLEAARLKAALDAHRSSRSWRLTAPLRRLAAISRRRK